MSFPIYPRLQGEAFPIQRRPIFNTIVQTAASGLETRIGNYLYPLSEWDIPYSWLSQEAALQDYQALYGLYVASFGQFSPFLYDDSEDNSTNGVPSEIAIGDGSTTTFQLGRLSGIGFEQIFDVNSTIAAPKIYVNGTHVTTGFTISATGLITFSSAPGVVPIAADFQYYWRVRFAIDDLEFSNFVTNWWEAQKVTLRQVRV